MAFAPRNLGWRVDEYNLEGRMEDGEVGQGGEQPEQ